MGIPVRAVVKKATVEFNGDDPKSQRGNELTDSMPVNMHTMIGPMSPALRSKR